MGDIRVDVTRFHEQGYLVVEDALDPVEDLQPVVTEYEQALDTLARSLYAEGKLTSLYADLPFGPRLTQVVVESGVRFHRYLDISVPTAGTTEQTPIHLGPAIFGLLINPRLIDAVEQVVGPEVLSNPIQHVRLKLPDGLVPLDQRSSMTAVTEWHQDQGVAPPEIDGTDMLTVWLPITDATEENGCLCLVPYSHRGELAIHCPGVSGGSKVLRIPDQLIGSQVISVPMRRGSVLFMHRRMKHSSLPNRSDSLRWSFDLRYQPIGQPTGRPGYPDFTVRSRQNPAAEVHDWRVWAAMWRATRSYLAANTVGPMHRWGGTEEVCAA